MTEWLVRLKGHEFDLGELSDHFASAKCNVKKDDDGYYYLRSSDFDQMTEPDAVRGRALRLIELMNGAAKLHAGEGYRPVEFDGLSRIDEHGRRHHHVFLSAVVEGRSRMTATPSVGGTANAPRPPSGAEHLVDLADQHQEVADALRFYERGDWVNLYKAWEVVCDAAGNTHQVVRNGWAAEPDRSRFTGTTQSREELGDEARHASEKFKAPKNPMSLEEARAFVRSVIRAWVQTL